MRRWPPPSVQGVGEPRRFWVEFLRGFDVKNGSFDADPLPPSLSDVIERLSRNPTRTFCDHAGSWSEIVWLSEGRAVIGRLTASEKSSRASDDFMTR